MKDWNELKKDEELHRIQMLKEIENNPNLHCMKPKIIDSDKIKKG